MNVKWTVRLLLAVIVGCFLIIGSKEIALGEAHYQSFPAIRELAKHTPEGTRCIFTLKSGVQVFGELLKYEAYNDYVWYQPQGTGHNVFKQDAFAIHELHRIDVIMEPV